MVADAAAVIRAQGMVMKQRIQNAMLLKFERPVHARAAWRNRCPQNTPPRPFPRQKGQRRRNALE